METENKIGEEQTMNFLMNTFDNFLKLNFKMVRTVKDLNAVAVLTLLVEAASKYKDKSEKRGPSIMCPYRYLCYGTSLDVRGVDSALKKLKAQGLLTFTRKGEFVKAKVNASRLNEILEGEVEGLFVENYF